MLKNQKQKIVFAVTVSIVMVLSAATFVLADEESDFPKAKEESIVRHCSSIKESLKATQRTDTHARTYLGSIYETVLNQFVTPLNVRLLKNNKAIPELTDLQTELNKERSDFNSSFISYSKTLEDLINTDCETAPKEFYSKLKETREERKTVDSHTKKIKQLLSEHKQEVTKLGESL